MSTHWNHASVWKCLVQGSQPYILNGVLTSLCWSEGSTRTARNHKVWIVVSPLGLFKAIECTFHVSFIIHNLNQKTLTKWKKKSQWDICTVPSKSEVWKVWWIKKFISSSACFCFELKSILIIIHSIIPSVHIL